MEFIAGREIGTQEELAVLLRESGWKVTQATVSRDIRELHLTKVTDPDGEQRYVSAALMNQHMKGKYTEVLKAAFISMDNAQNMLVIKTASGMAMAAAAALDALHMPEILGCIAGDDTIMAAIRSEKDAVRVMDHLDKMLEE